MLGLGFDGWYVVQENCGCLLDWWVDCRLLSELLIAEFSCVSLSTSALAGTFWNKDCVSAILSAWRYLWFWFTSQWLFVFCCDEPYDDANFDDGLFWRVMNGNRLMINISEMFKKPCIWHIVLEVVFCVTYSLDWAGVLLRQEVVLITNWGEVNIIYVC